MDSGELVRCGLFCVLGCVLGWLLDGRRALAELAGSGRIDAVGGGGIGGLILCWRNKDRGMLDSLFDGLGFDCFRSLSSAGLLLIVVAKDRLGVGAVFCARLLTRFAGFGAAMAGECLAGQNGSAVPS